MIRKKEKTKKKILKQNSIQVNENQIKNKAVKKGELINETIKTFIQMFIHSSSFGYFFMQSRISFFYHINVATTFL